MTPSNRQPRTSAHGLRRAFLLQAASGLLTALLVAPAPALAQGLIGFSVGSTTFTRYQFDGTSLRTLPFPQVPYAPIHVTARSYPGVGRLYLYPYNNNLMAWSEATGQSKAVTNISGPLSVQTNNHWSNDGLDSFFSFNLVDANGNSSLYRAHVSAADIASDTYQPITLADLGTPRVEYVADQGGGFVTYWWNHAGSGYFYIDPSNRTNIRFKAVGGGDTFIWSAPAELSELQVIPPVDPLNPVSDRYLVATGLTRTSRMQWQKGILAIDLGSPLEPPNSRWLATEPGTGFSDIRGPSFSPDGSYIAFGGVRTVTVSKKQSYTGYGVYTVPFAFGGPITITRVAEVTTGSGYVTVNNWNLP